MAHVEELSASIRVEAPWAHESAGEWDACTATEYIDGFMSDASARTEAKLYVQTVRVCCCLNLLLQTCLSVKCMGSYYADIIACE
jgi:hypothetical protein